ncbi:MAG: MFS transporter [Pseudobdellovibrionaceae bacterium]
MNQKQPSGYKKIVILAALGYFVDIFDLIIFGIVRQASLTDLGYVGEQITQHGIFILNMQMIGMLIGGLFWGMLGDKKGRIVVLIGSIMTYSIANVATGFVQDANAYALWRFIGGIGLAGELGAGITLALEAMPKNIRGIGATIIASFGVLGAVAAELVGNLVHWRSAYIIGGAMGLVLMVFRFTAVESEMFKESKEKDVQHGSFLSILKNKSLFIKYGYCVLIGTPIWFTIGLLGYFSPEFSKALNIQGAVTAGKTIMYLYIGLSVGDILSGLFSQFLKSRKQAVYGFMAFLAASALAYLNLNGASATTFYFVAFLLGIGAGYWALMAINASEQFGTNFRSTAATSVPNFVRASVVPMTLVVNYLKADIGLVQATLLVGAVVFSIGGFAAYKMQETFHKDLNYVE